MNHPKDIEYFSQYPAPLFEAIHEKHFTNINATITFFSPMLYFFARAIGAEQILEIGHAEGVTAHYLAHALKDNGVRYGMKGNRYYGIDIVQTEKVRAALKAEGLPVTVVNMDSKLLTPETFNTKFDIIFQDGNHTADYVTHEFKTMWPAVKDGGYWIAHDCFGPSEDGCNVIKNLIDKGEIKAEYIRIFEAYGLMIIRKMDNFDYIKKHWCP